MKASKLRKIIREELEAQLTEQPLPAEVVKFQKKLDKAEDSLKKLSFELIKYLDKKGEKGLAKKVASLYKKYAIEFFIKVNFEVLHAKALKELNVTANVAGYQTPKAFRGKTKAKGSVRHSPEKYGYGDVNRKGNTYLYSKGKAKK